jgi:hypothetical protein
MSCKYSQYNSMQGAVSGGNQCFGICKWPDMLWIIAQDIHERACLNIRPSMLQASVAHSGHLWDLVVYLSSHSCLEKSCEDSFIPPPHPHMCMHACAHTEPLISFKCVYAKAQHVPKAKRMSCDAFVSSIFHYTVGFHVEQSTPHARWMAQNYVQ